jgi:hypothetical protein
MCCSGSRKLLPVPAGKHSRKTAACPGPPLLLRNADGAAMLFDDLLGYPQPEAGMEVLPNSLRRPKRVAGSIYTNAEVPWRRD